MIKGEGRWETGSSSREGEGQEREKEREVERERHEICKMAEEKGRIRKTAEVDGKR